MAGELWRQVAQVGKETVYGTGVAATRKVYLEQVSLTDEREPRPHDFMTGTREQTRAYTQGPSIVGGSVQLPLSADELLEWLLITIQGGVTPSTPVGTVRLWTFKPGNTLDSMTLEYDDGAIARRALGVYGNSIQFQGSANGEQMVNLDLFGKSRAANALTGSLTDRVPTFMEGWETKIYIEAFGGTPGTTVIASTLLDWNVQIANNMGRKFTADNVNVANRAVIGKLAVTATLGFEAVGSTVAAEIANWEAATKRTVRLEFGQNDVIESTYKRFVTIDLPGAWTTPQMTDEDEGTRKYSFGLQAVYDPTTIAAMLQIRCQNARTAAWA